jgi:molybdenum cofactor cytidylyltransferase
MADIPIILLAAGGSSRLGQPKQLLPWGEQTIIEHQIKMLMQSGESVIVVLGAYADRILPVVEKYPVTVVVNNEWKTGMAGSIGCGIKAMERLESTVEAVLITLVDQPLIPFSHFEEMLNAFEEGMQQIIASTSAEGWLGVPALFDKCYFSELQNLQGEKGAKTLIQQYPNKIKALVCNEIINDIDTLESYQELCQKHLI